MSLEHTHTFGHLTLSLQGPLGLQAALQKSTGLLWHLCVIQDPMEKIPHAKAMEMLLGSCMQTGAASPLCPWLGVES